MPRLILAVILCFLPLVSVQATRPVLKIGLTSTTCGNTAGIAINQVQSLRWWANDTNARGGITVNGTVYDVDFVIYNDAIDPELVSILYDRLVNVDQVDLLMGPFGTNLFRAAPYAQQYKIPMMNIGDFTYYSSSNAPNGTFGGWLFSSVPNPLRLVSPCLEILKTKDVSTLASAWTTEVADTSLNLLNFLAAGNAQMAVLSAPANIKTDLSNVDDVIDSLEKFDAPAFSGGMFTATQNAELIDAFIRRKYLPAARIFWVGPAFDAFRTAAGWRGASLLFPDVWNPSLNFTDPEYGNSEGFFNAYKAGTGREPDSTDIMAMHGATAFKLALERANSLNGDAIRIALSELNDEAWMGIANFSGAFQQTTSEYYCFQLNSTGRGIKPVSLNARARANLVYPAEISIPSGYYPSNSKRKLALGLGLGLGLGVVVLVLLGAFFYWLVVKYQIVFIPKSEDKGEW